MAEDRAQDGQAKEPTPRVEKTVVLNRDEILRMAQVESGGKSEAGNTAQLPRTELDRARAGRISDSGKDGDTRQRARVREERPRVIREGEAHASERRSTQPRREPAGREQGETRKAQERQRATRQPQQTPRPQHRPRPAAQQRTVQQRPTPAKRPAQAPRPEASRNQAATRRQASGGAARAGQPRQQVRHVQPQRVPTVQAGPDNTQHRSPQRPQGQSQQRVRQRPAAGASHARRAQPRPSEVRPRQQQQAHRQARSLQSDGTRHGQVAQRPAQHRSQQVPQARHASPASRSGAPAARQVAHRQGQLQQHATHQQVHTQRRPSAAQVRTQHSQHAGRTGGGQHRPPSGQARQQAEHGPRRRTPLAAIIAAVAVVLVVVFAVVRCNNARIAAQQAEQARQEQEQQAEQGKASQIAGLEAGTYYIEPVDTESGVLAFDVSGVGDDAYTTVMVSELTQTSAQQIKLDISDDGSTCTLTNGSLYLDAGDVTAGSGRALFANKSDGGDTQRWKLSQNSDGSYSIISAASDSLAIAVESAYDGAPVTVEDADSSSEAQHFRILSQSRVDTTGSTNANGAGSEKENATSGNTNADETSGVNANDDSSDNQ